MQKLNIIICCSRSFKKNTHRPTLTCFAAQNVLFFIGHKFAHTKFTKYYLNTDNILFTKI